jgi:hypothetical protein
LDSSTLFDVALDLLSAISECKGIKKRPKTTRKTKPFKISRPSETMDNDMNTSFNHLGIQTGPALYGRCAA